MFNWILPVLRPGFWFSVNAQPFMPWLDKALPIFMAFLLVLGIGFLAYGRMAKGIEKESRRFWHRVGMLEFSAGVTGLLLYFFVWQGIPVLSMRILWVVWLGGFGWWKWMIWKEHFRMIPAEKAKAKEREAYEKWLPKPKK